MKKESEKKFPYRAVWDGLRCEVVAEYKDCSWVFFLDEPCDVGLAVFTDELYPLPEKPYSFGEFALSEERGWVGPDDAVYRRLTDLYNKYQDYLKQFNQ